MVQSGLSSAENFVSLIAHVEELIDAGNLREGRRVLTQFFERKRLDSRMLPALAALYMRVGKPQQAIDTIRSAIEQVGPNSDLHNTMGLILASLGREKESRDQFEEALRLDEGNYDAMRNLAFSIHRSGDKPRAYALLIECYEAMPLSVELRLICGTLLELDGRIEEAICCFREVMELTTAYEQIRVASQRLCALGMDDSIESFEDVIAMLSSKYLLSETGDTVTDETGYMIA